MHRSGVRRNDDPAELAVEAHRDVLAFGHPREKGLAVEPDREGFRAAVDGDDRARRDRLSRSQDQLHQRGPVSHRPEVDQHAGARQQHDLAHDFFERHIHWNGDWVDGDLDRVQRRNLGQRELAVARAADLLILLQDAHVAQVRDADNGKPLLDRLAGDEVAADPGDRAGRAGPQRGRAGGIGPLQRVAPVRPGVRDAARQEPVGVRAHVVPEALADRERSLQQRFAPVLDVLAALRRQDGRRRAGEPIERNGDQRERLRLRGRARVPAQRQRQVGVADDAAREARGVDAHRLRREVALTGVPDAQRAEVAERRAEEGGGRTRNARKRLPDLGVARGRARRTGAEREQAALAIEPQQDLGARSAVHAAERGAGAHHADAADQQVASDSGGGAVPVELGARFGGEVLGESHAQVAGGVPVAVVEVPDPVVEALGACADRELREAGSQQLLRDVERLRDHALLAEGVAHDEVQVACAGDRRNVGDAERAGRDVLAADAHVVHQHFGGARDRRQAADRQQRVGDEAGLQRVVGTELHAAEADCLAPPARRGNRVADLERPELARGRPSASSCPGRRSALR